MVNSNNADSFSLQRFPYLPENYTEKDLKRSWSTLILAAWNNDERLYKRLTTPVTIATSVSATDLPTALVLLNEIKDALVKRRIVT